MQSMLDSVEYGQPVTAGVLGSEIYERFEREIDNMAIAVVDEDEAPVGLIERNAFMLKFASQYGRALYTNRPIELLMDRDPIITDSGSDVAQFTREGLE